MSDSFAARLRRGDSLVGAWTSIGHPVVAAVLAAEPVDFVVLDGEHSENTIGDLADCVRAVEAANHRSDRAESGESEASQATDGDGSTTANDDGSRTATVVRASGPDRAEIKRLLDLGVDAILVPQIDSYEDAAAALRASQYPPEGVRGVAGGRAANYGTDLGGYFSRANEDVATILQVETAGAINDVEEIAALDGLDAVFVGPADLSARLDAFGDFESEEFRGAVERVAEATRDVSSRGENEVAAGTLATSLENAPVRSEEWGMDFVVAGVDVSYLRDGLEGYLDALE